MASIGAERIGIDAGRTLRLEEAVTCAADHGVRLMDIQLNTDGNVVVRFDAARAAEKRSILAAPENLNEEPTEAEIHVLAGMAGEQRHYYDSIDSPGPALSIRAKRAHLVLEGVDRFIDAIAPPSR